MASVAIRHEIRIRATAERVWSELVAFERFPEWNPMIVRMKGRPEEGSSIAFRVRLENGLKLPLWGRIVRCRASEELRWRAGVPGLLSGEHYVTLMPTGGGVIVAHGEDFRGALCAVLGGTLRRLGAPLYARMNEALKARTEPPEVP